MKILHLIYDHINNPWVGGGGAVRVYEIYKRLSANNQITVVCGRYPMATDYSEGNLSFHFVGTGRCNYFLSILWYMLRSKKFLRRYAEVYDVVVEDFAPYNPLFSFLRNRKAIIQLHQKEGFHHFKKHLFLGLLFFLIEAYYPKLFTNAVTVSDVSSEKYGVRGHAVMIPNGIAPEYLESETCDGDYILFIGRLDVDQKGLDILSYALRYIKGDSRLVIAGRGREEGRVLKMFGEYINKGIVESVGFVNGIVKNDLIRKSKLIVVPSRYEAQCIVIIEAAACGKPVIVSDIRDLRYAVDAGFGLSFRTGDSKDLADKIELLCGDKLLRSEMGQKAREYAKGYTWDAVAESFENYLLTVLGRI